MHKKKCIKCNVEKRRSEFYKLSYARLGVKDSCKKCDRSYRKEILDKIVETKRQKKEISEDRKEYVREYARKYRNNRRKTDPIYKLRKNTSDLVSKSFKRGKNKFTKTKRSEEILGCSMIFFIRYIKGQFKKGMTLDNYGEWHLDHIKPVSLAQTEEEVIELNHYTNFQPLWAFDNKSKSNKIINKQLRLI